MASRTQFGVKSVKLIDAASKSGIGLGVKIGFRWNVFIVSVARFWLETRPADHYDDSSRVCTRRRTRNMPRSASQLRRDALQIWQAGVEAVRSDRLVRQALRVNGRTVEIGMPLSPAAR